jgi:hypothetical protein
MDDKGYFIFLLKGLSKKRLVLKVNILYPDVINMPAK